MKKAVRVITLDLKVLVMLLGMKAGLGRRTAKLPFPLILRHKGATERAAKSLTILADVRARSRVVLAERNLSSAYSRGSKEVLSVFPVRKQTPNLLQISVVRSGRRPHSLWRRRSWGPPGVLPLRWSRQAQLVSSMAWNRARGELFGDP